MSLARGVVLSETPVAFAASNDTSVSSEKTNANNLPAFDVQPYNEIPGQPMQNNGPDAGTADARTKFVVDLADIALVLPSKKQRRQQKRSDKTYLKSLKIIYERRKKIYLQTHTIQELKRLQSEARREMRLAQALERFDILWAPSSDH